MPATTSAQHVCQQSDYLADFEHTLGSAHPRTLTNRNNLADAYLDAGRTTEAITLHECNLAHRERLLGPDHPEPCNPAITSPAPTGPRTDRPTPMP